VKSIGTFDFDGCLDLVEVNLESMASAGGYYFWNFKQLRSVTLNNTIEEIGDGFL
jgi:hypothetical protein